MCRRAVSRSPSSSSRSRHRAWRSVSPCSTSSARQAGDSRSSRSLLARAEGEHAQLGRHRLLGHARLVEKGGDGRRLLQVVQVLPLQVLHQGQQGGGPVVHLRLQAGHRLQPRQHRPPAAAAPPPPAPSPPRSAARSGAGGCRGGGWSPPAPPEPPAPQRSAGAAWDWGGSPPPAATAPCVPACPWDHLLVISFILQGLSRKGRGISVEASPRRRKSGRPMGGRHADTAYSHDRDGSSARRAS